MRDASIRSVTARAYRIPTDAPEADGTIQWDATTLLEVEIEAGDCVGPGYSYAGPATVSVVSGILADRLIGKSPVDIPALWVDMVRGVRNIGRDGIAISAISAVDVALWDLKARLLDLSLEALFGRARHSVPIYGSGGFTSYSMERLTAQLAGWVEDAGCKWVKMKIGADPASDHDRVRAASEAIGVAELMVDANGAYTRQQALKFACQFTDLGVTWFEEPVSSDDIEGLHSIRENAPPGLEIAAGEYAYNAFESRALLQHQAVDVLQIDATRCGGYTGFLKAAALADAWNLPVSAHTAPALHLPVCCAVPRCRHIEWFHDHARIEAMLFDGAPVPRDGAIAPQAGAKGHGLAFRHDDAERFALA